MKRAVLKKDILKGEAIKLLLFSLAMMISIAGCQYSAVRNIQSTSAVKANAKPSLVPQSCFQTAAKITFQNSKGIDSRFGKCPSTASFPERGAKKPELAPAYFATLSDNFNTLTKCLGTKNPKSLIPKFTGESGFYPSALGPYKELGIGQLTEAAILDVLPHLKKYRRIFEASGDLDCQKLATESELWQETSFDKGCALASDEKSAQRNILYSLIYHELLRSWISSDLKKFFVVNDLMALYLFPTAPSEYTQASWTLEKDRYHVSDLEGLLTAVSYNVGSRGIVLYLKDYLSKRIEAGSKVTKDDFNFKEDLSWLNKRSKKQLDDLKVTQLSFPAYLKVYQKWGHPGYGPDMMKLIYKFNESVGFHVCTPERIEGYLAL